MFWVSRDFSAFLPLFLKCLSQVKLGDFGLTRQLPPDQDYWRLEKTGRLPVKYMAIETLTSKRFSPASDVWAFGVFMWEVLSYGKNPWDTQGVPAKEVRSVWMRLGGFGLELFFGLTRLVVFDIVAGTFGGPAAD